MKDHFDLIAIPKGQSPGGPIQASNGEWYIVLPAFLDAAQAWGMYCDMRAGRPVSEGEMEELRSRLMVRSR